ncbi:Tn3 family transposase [Abyssisolibacter fermentans]|uniref:Tn3 family transposase n=1 Tax=Abyssisolibacter fermentans TaxID=1766203 RepID=UPI00082DEB3B
MQAQLQLASALNILINTISVWNTTYLHEAVKYLSTKKNIDKALLGVLFCNIKPKKENPVRVNSPTGLNPTNYYM